MATCDDDELDFAKTGGGSLAAVFLILLVFRSCCSGIIGSCGCGQRPQLGVGWTWVHIMWIIWFATLLIVSGSTPDTCTSPKSTIKGLSTGVFVVSGVSLLFSTFCKPFKLKLFGLPVPFDHALRVTFVLASLGVSAMLGIAFG